MRRNWQRSDVDDVIELYIGFTESAFTRWSPERIEAARSHPWVLHMSQFEIAELEIAGARLLDSARPFHWRFWANAAYVAAAARGDDRSPARRRVAVSPSMAHRAVASNAAQRAWIEAHEARDQGDEDRARERAIDAITRRALHGEEVDLRDACEIVIWSHLSTVGDLAAATETLRELTRIDFPGWRSSPYFAVVAQLKVALESGRPADLATAARLLRKPPFSRPDLALGAIDVLRQWRPGPFATATEAAALADLGDTVRARDVIDALLPSALTPFHTNVRVRIELLEDQTTAALRWAERGLELDADDPGAVRMYAVARLRGGDPVAGIVWPTDERPAVPIHLAVRAAEMLHELGATSDAISALEAILDREPDFSPARAALARIYAS